MAEFGVYFNYKKDNICAFLYCVMITIIIIFFMTASAFLYEFYQGDKISLEYYLMGEVLVISAQTLPFLTYVILLKSLHERYVAVNTLLRFFHFSCSQITKLFIIYSCVFKQETFIID